MLGIVANQAPISRLSHSNQILSRAVTFQFTLDPNLKQRSLFAQCAGARRFTVNHHLARVKANLETRVVEESSSKGDRSRITSTPSLSWSGFAFVKEFNAWKNGSTEDSLINEDGSRGLSWRHELPGDVFECASVDAARSLENFTSSRRGDRKGAKVGFPRFQCKGKVIPRFRIRNHVTPGQFPSKHPIRFNDNGRLRIPKIGDVKVFGPTRKIRRMIERGRFHIYSATFTERAGRWIVSLNGVATELHQTERSRSTRHPVPIGIDRGITSLAVAADANGIPFGTFEGVKIMREAQASIAAANRALARTTPGSEGRLRARARVAKSHRKVAMTRRHLVHQVTNSLVMRSQVLVLEDLNVAGMVRNRRLAKAVSDAAMGELFRQILYKGKWHGVEVRIADRFFPSTKTCSGCGDISAGLDLALRTFSCKACGLVIDRDLNAAINLARWRPEGAISKSFPAPTSILLLSND
jgi:putative transposase